MLDSLIAAESEKLETAAGRVDEAFRVSEREWLELRARMTTVLRLMRERDPGNLEVDRMLAGAVVAERARRLTLFRAETV